MDVTEKTVSITIKGIRPLLHNKFTNEKSGKKKQNYDPTEEATKKLIVDENNNPGIKLDWIYGTLVKSGTEFKFKGRKTYKDAMKSCIDISPDDVVPLENADWTIDERSVVIGGKSRVPCWRPRFSEGWRCSFDLKIRDADSVSPLKLKEILENAGRFHGIGDYRPRFGLFEIEKFEVKD